MQHTDLKLKYSKFHENYYIELCGFRLFTVWKPEELRYTSNGIFHGRCVLDGNLFEVNHGSIAMNYAQNTGKGVSELYIELVLNNQKFFYQSKNLVIPDEGVSISLNHFLKILDRKADHEAQTREVEEKKQKVSGQDEKEKNSIVSPFVNDVKELLVSEIRKSIDGNKEKAVVMFQLECALMVFQRTELLDKIHSYLMEQIRDVLMINNTSQKDKFDILFSVGSFLSK